MTFRFHLVVFCLNVFSPLVSFINKVHNFEHVKDFIVA